MDDDDVCALQNLHTIFLPNKNCNLHHKWCLDLGLKSSEMHMFGFLVRELFGEDDLLGGIKILTIATGESHFLLCFVLDQI